MDAITNIKSRRSVRKYTDQVVEQDVIRKIMEAVIYAPSWKNTQVIRYTIIQDQDMIQQIADEATAGFVYNQKTIQRAGTIAVQTVVTGICGYEADGTFSTDKGTGWEMFDAGISAQTFCLAAHEYQVGTVIMGIFDYVKIKGILGLPEGETVTAVIGMGYYEGEKPAPERKSVDEVCRFI